MKRPAILIVLIPALCLAGCAGTQTLLAPAGEQADRLASLLGLMTSICGGMYLLVLAFTGWSLWRARRPRETDGSQVTPQDRGLTRALIGWAILIPIGLTVLAVGSFLADRGLARARDRDALEVRVTAHQWWWRIAYRDPVSGGWIETANELHLPAGRTARVTLGSADVIHSFWVPNVAGKMNVIPGHANVIDMTPHRIGSSPPHGAMRRGCGAS